MTVISHELLADAVVRVERMSSKDKIRLGDEIHEHQPNLLLSVLVLSRYGATFGIGPGRG